MMFSKAFELLILSIDMLGSLLNIMSGVCIWWHIAKRAYDS